jgi:hypothetical protein
MSNGRKATAARKSKRAQKKVSRATGQAHKGTSSGRRGGVSKMAKTAKKRRNTARKNPVMIIAPAHRKNPSKRRNKRKNPFVAKRRGQAYKRNPQFAGFSLTSMTKVIAGGLGGGLATRALPSLILKDKNTGPIGILSNVVTAGALAWITSKWDRDIAAGVIAGGGAVTLQRVWDVYVAKVISDGKGMPALAAGKPVTTPAAAAANQSAPDGTPKLGDVSFSSDGLGLYNKATWPQVQIGDELDPANPAPAHVDGTFKPPFASMAAA